MGTTIQYSNKKIKYSIEKIKFHIQKIGIDNVDEKLRMEVMKIMELDGIYDVEFETEPTPEILELPPIKEQTLVI